MRGLYSHSREYRRIFLRDHLLHVSQILEGWDFISVQIHLAPVFAPARIQEKIPGEFFLYWFRARGYCDPAGLAKSPKSPETKKYEQNTKSQVSSTVSKVLGDQGPLNVGVSNGVASRSGLVLPFCSFLSFLGLSRFFRDFSGIFPICSGMVRGFSRFVLLLSRPFKSTYEEQSRKGPRHNLDLSREK